MSKSLWVEQYRPSTLDEYVWRDPELRAKVEEWIAEGAAPHILLSGSPGTGKTSLAYLLTRELKVPEGDVLFIAASSARTVDLFQDKVMNFFQTYPMIDNEHGLKYIILDEADTLSQTSQKFLRTEIETNSEYVRVIITCNYPNKIEPAVYSRCQKIRLEQLDKMDFAARAGEILVREKVEFEPETLLAFVEASYPDLRDCINEMSSRVIGGKLLAPEANTRVAHDYLIDAVDHFRNGRVVEGRSAIIANASVEEYDDIYRFMYQNLDLWSLDPVEQDEALIIIRDALYKHAIIGDAEINLAATLVQLTRYLRT